MKLGYSINLSDNRILNETDFFTRIEKVIDFYQTKNYFKFFFDGLCLKDMVFI